jgi:predicted metalloprotease with PDZ domain
VIVLAITTALFASTAHAAIRYTVSLAHPEQHLFRVSVEVPDVHGELKFQMAAWNALYEIRDFSSHVQQVQAFVNGQKADITKLDKLTWQVTGSGTVNVTYSTFWDDVGPFSTQLNSEHAFINPAMILLYAPERRAEECVLLLNDVPAAWKVASATHGSSSTECADEAPSYDVLADAPIEASAFEEFTIHDLLPPVDVVIHGDNWKRRDVEMP